MSDLSKQQLVETSASWAARAQGLVITDRESCVNASHLLKSIKSLRAEIANWFEPHLTAASETKRKAEAARKGLADEQTRMEAGLVAAEQLIKTRLLAFEAAQERLRREEEQRLQQEAQQRAEAATLAAAAALELEANTTGDAEMLQEAQDILAQPIEAPVVSLAKLVPKVEGITYRDNWKAHPDIDVKALAAAVASGQAPVTFLQPNLTAINQFARATQGAQAVAGIKFYNDRLVAARA